MMNVYILTQMVGCYFGDRIVVLGVFTDERIATANFYRASRLSSRNFRLTKIPITTSKCVSFITSLSDDSASSSDDLASSSDDLMDDLKHYYNEFGDKYISPGTDAKEVYLHRTRDMFSDDDWTKIVDCVYKETLEGKTTVVDKLSAFEESLYDWSSQISILNNEIRELEQQRTYENNPRVLNAALNNAKAKLKAINDEITKLENTTVPSSLALEETRKKLEDIKMPTCDDLWKQIGVHVIADEHGRGCGSGRGRGGRRGRGVRGGRGGHMI